MNYFYKWAIAVLILISFSFGCISQSFNKGSMVVSTGYGFPNLSYAVSALYFQDYPYNFDAKQTGIGPLHGKVEYGLSNVVGLGLSVNYVNNSITYTSYYGGSAYQNKDVWNSVKFNLRTNFHFVRSRDFDVYAGFGLGYGLANGTHTSNDPSYPSEKVKNNFPVGGEVTVGARYYFTPNIGLYTELGIAKSIIQIGTCFKFGGSSEDIAY